MWLRILKWSILGFFVLSVAGTAVGHFWYFTATTPIGYFGASDGGMGLGIRGGQGWAFSVQAEDQDRNGIRVFMPYVALNHALPAKVLLPWWLLLGISTNSTCLICLWRFRRRIYATSLGVLLGFLAFSQFFHCYLNSTTDEIQASRWGVEYSMYDGERPQGWGTEAVWWPAPPSALLKLFKPRPRLIAYDWSSGFVDDLRLPWWLIVLAWGSWTAGICFRFRARKVTRAFPAEPPPHDQPAGLKGATTP